ncbi:flagellar hook-associated protein FlgK [Bacillus sp. B-jedd]|uniref:flagellar hook-associated protein FlgK n=1 Tax=Bacillus sp. B-jedd TaxID=1476857 RepID=UPI00051571B9|nr:flagellar hook-associated protein FlgK [Bacillus sp. B-jedd]CEG25904.1 flagellar hook-associated protein FlgK [Bacillus sp. B-jedd]
MASTFHGLELGKRGLFAQQTALSITGHNIGNANTIGYSRQRAEMQATNAIPGPGMNNDRSPSQLGTGVAVNKIVRLREEYLDVQFRGEYKNFGYWEAKSDTFMRIEELLNEPSESGLSVTMDEFWKGWEELTKNPESSSARGVVRQRGVAVAETFNHLAASLNQIKSDLKNVISTKEKEVNSLASQIANLNDQISRLVPNNYQPNDLYDQRDVLVDQLSKLVDIKVAPGEKGMVNIAVGTEFLVSGKTKNDFSIGYDDTGKLVDPAKIKIGENSVAIGNGELLGTIESYGLLGQEKTTGIPSIQDKIDTLAKTIIDSINSLHEQGYDLDGNPTTGVPFFTGSSASDMKVNPEIMKSLNLIAAARAEEDGTTSSGNGKNAQAIADLKFTNLDFGGTDSTADDFYRNIIGHIGIDSREAQRMRDNSVVIIQQVENRRQSVSGVSLDEEMANMIKFQQSYNAAARYVTVMDQLLDKVINGMGRAGL